MLSIKETSEVGLRPRPSLCYYEFELLSERTLQFSGKNQYPISASTYSMFLSPYYIWELVFLRWYSLKATG